MRRSVLVLVAVVTLAAACGSEDDAARRFAADEHVVTVEDGESFELVLDSNITTGFGWQVVAGDGSILRLADREYVASEDDDALGAGGRDVFRFEAGGTGTEELVLEYVRPSDPDAVEDVRRYTVVVGGGNDAPPDGRHAMLLADVDLDGRRLVGDVVAYRDGEVDRGEQRLVLLAVADGVDVADLAARLERERAAAPHDALVPVPFWVTVADGTVTDVAPAVTCSASDLDPQLPDDPALPAAVDAVRRDLARAAVTCDWELLAELVDRGGPAVRFSFGAEDDPIAYWKAEEERSDVPPLRALRLLLALPATGRDPGDGTVQWFWPAAYAPVGDVPTEAQLQEVAATGLYPMATLRAWVDGGMAYLGYRVLVTETGDWTAFVAGD